MKPAVVLLACLVAVTASCSESHAPEAGGPADENPDVGTRDLLIGADVSFLPEIEDHGGTYSDPGGSRDLLILLKEHGFDSIRLRLWHTPEGPYNTLDRVRSMAARVDAAGLELFLDIHYSDSWADPGHQIRPAAWSGLTFDALVDSVYQYSYAVIAALRAQGTVPALVQIGNEIRAGMLWPDGRVGGAYDTPEQWDRLIALLDAGRRGVLDAAGNQPPDIVIHLDDGGDNGVGRWFFDHLTERGLNFDAIGVSFYPKWHGTLRELGDNITDLSSRYAKDVYVVETAYPWTLAWRDDTANIFGAETDLHTGYPATVSGQGAFLSAVSQVVRDVPGERGAGLFYWSPEWLALEGVPSAWENATLFDFEGRALASMDAFTGGD